MAGTNADNNQGFNESLSSLNSKKSLSPIPSIEIESVIHHGKWCTIYRAHDSLLDRIVAYKRFTYEIGDDRLLQRFRREAIALKEIDHKNITKYFSYHDDEKTPSIVMEYVNGETLESFRARKGELSKEEITEITTQILQGLAVLHKHNLIHRNLSPKNILVTPELSVKIIDFGFSKPASERKPQESTATLIDENENIFYRPPNLETNELSFGSDLFAVGRLVLFMDSGSAASAAKLQLPNSSTLRQIVQRTEQLSQSQDPSCCESIVRLLEGAQYKKKQVQITALIPLLAVILILTAIPLFTTQKKAARATKISTNSFTTREFLKRVHEQELFQGDQAFQKSIDTLESWKREGKLPEPDQTTTLALVRYHILLSKLYSVASREDKALQELDIAKSLIELPGIKKGEVDALSPKFYRIAIKSREAEIIPSKERRRFLENSRRDVKKLGRLTETECAEYLSLLTRLLNVYKIDGDNKKALDLDNEIIRLSKARGDNSSYITALVDGLSLRLNGNDSSNRRVADEFTDQILEIVSNDGRLSVVFFRGQLAEAISIMDQFNCTKEKQRLIDGVIERYRNLDIEGELEIEKVWMLAWLWQQPGIQAPNKKELKENAQRLLETVEFSTGYDLEHLRAGIAIKSALEIAKVLNPKLSETELQKAYPVPQMEKLLLKRGLVKA